MNVSVYDQLKKRLKITDAYEKWHKYRENITELIIGFTEQGSSLLIVGAGDCNDYDVNILADHFSNITLLDREDVDSYQNRYAKSSVVTRVQADLVGISDDCYRRFSEFVFNSILRYDADELIVNEIKRIYNRARPLFIDERYDYIVSFGVHSQLNIMLYWICETYYSNIGKDLSVVKSVIMSETNKLVRNVDDFLIAVAKRGIIIGNEEKKYGDGTPIEGACQCINDILSRYSEGQLRNLRVGYTDWPFDPDRNILYEMKILISDVI